jgi:uncharacterized protein YdaU (DUF1376 family)
MNFYSRFPGDYQRDTNHLTLCEHGAYAVLLDVYYSTERPLPSDMAALYRVCRAMDEAERAAVKSVVDQFFPIDPNDGLRHNKRCDAEIPAAKTRIDIAKKNGKSGGRPPKQKPIRNPAGFQNETQQKPSENPAGYFQKPSGLAKQNPEETQRQSSPYPYPYPYSEDLNQEEADSLQGEVGGDVPRWVAA